VVPEKLRHDKGVSHVNSLRLNVLGKMLNGSTVISDSNYELIWDLQEKSGNKILMKVSTSDLLVYQTYDELPFYEWMFKGKTENSESVRCTGGALISRGGIADTAGIQTKLTFSFTEIQIGDRQLFEKVEYYVPNFRIGFDQMRDVLGKRERSISDFVVQQGDYELKVVLESLVELDKLQNLVDGEVDNFTVKMIIENQVGSLEYDDFASVTTLLFDLCTVAYGDKVSWGHAVFFHNGKKQFEVLRYPSQFCSLSPARQQIAVEKPAILTGFLQETFEHYVKVTNEARSKFLAFVEGLQIACNTLIFPIPFVVLGTAIEDYCASVLATKKEYFVPRNVRKKLLPNFLEWVSQNIESEIDENDWQEFNDSLPQKFSALFQRNLRTRITNLLAHYRISFDPAWVSEFVKKRNTAAHGTYVFTNEDYIIWTRMAALMESVIRRELHYTGEFWDFSETPVTEKIFRSYTLWSHIEKLCGRIIYTVKGNKFYVVNVLQDRVVIEVESTGKTHTIYKSQVASAFSIGGITATPGQLWRGRIKSATSYIAGMLQALR
jgi:hypothetical protein